MNIEDILKVIKNKSTKILGFSNEDEYNYLLKKIYDYIHPLNSITVDNGFPIPCNAEIINSVQKSLNTIDLNNLKKDDIILTNNIPLNKKIQDAILKYLQPELLKNFNNKYQKENLFVQHIVWIYERINQVNWNETPYLLYFGNTNINDEIHLLILNEIGFQIIFINPRLKIENPFIKQLTLNEEIIFQNYANCDKLFLRIAKAKEPIVIKNNSQIIQTVAKKAKDEFSANMYKNNSIFKPWQFKKGFTSPIYIDAVIEDIKTYWNQDARFREGFEIKNETIESLQEIKECVYIPNFFTKINGSYFNKIDYKELVNFTKNSQLTIFKTSTELLKPTFNKEDMFSLMFVMSYDKVDFDKIKNHKLYNLSRVNVDVQKFIINKYNEFVQKFKNNVQQTDLIYLLASIINSDLEFIKLIENFDFPFRIPKIVIYLKDRESFDLNNSLFIHYLNLIGFDIIIFSPTGSESIEENLFGNYLNIITLEEMNYDLDYDNLNNYKKVEKKNFFQKLFD